MSNKQIEKAIKSAAYSTEIEGYVIDDTVKELCRKLLKKEITMEDYISIVKSRAEVTV